MTDSSSPAPRRWLKHAIGASVTLGCLIVFFRQVDFHDVLTALDGFHWAYLLLGVASLSVDYALRVFRWSMMLRATGATTGFSRCAAPFLGSIALNNVLPLRLGDVVRALVFPRAMGIPKTTATSSLIMERVIDLMTLLASMAIGLYAIQTIEIPAELLSSAISLALLGGISLIAALIFSKPIGNLFQRLAGRAEVHPGLARAYATASTLLHGFDAMSRPRVLIGILAISMLVWAGEAGLFYAVLLGAGMEGTPSIALLVMSVATLSTLVPSSPGYVGPFHLAVFTAVSLVGGTAAQAGSYAVIVHLALWLPTTVAGALAIWANPSLFRAAKSQADNG